MLYLGRGDCEIVVGGHSTAIFFIMANFTSSSVRADCCQNQAKPYFLGCIAECRMKSLTSQISYDIGIREAAFLKQSFFKWAVFPKTFWLYHTQYIPRDQVNRLFEMIWLLQITLQDAAMTKSSGQMVTAGNWDPRVLALARYPQALA